MSKDQEPWYEPQELFIGAIIIHPKRYKLITITDTPVQYPNSGYFLIHYKYTIEGGVGQMEVPPETRFVTP